ncbi:MAG TPA: hypothetical protein VGH28_19800 [Polyangiaceae bacterium]
MKHGLTILVMGALALGACSKASDNDPPQTLNPNPLGPGDRLRDVQDPASQSYAPNQNVDVTSVVVTAVDEFDETHNGKSRGTIFVQDADQALPYAGISLYSPTYVPANLRLAPGDVVDMNGQYVEQQTIGTTVNFAPAFLPQMSKPQVQLQFETQEPQPVEVPLSDLQSFDTARKWIGMLVVVKDVTMFAAPSASDSSGRVSAAITNDANSAALNNELWDLQPWTGTNTSNSFAAGTHFASVTGIVDFFFNIFLCTRSMNDLVQ